MTEKQQIGTRAERIGPLCTAVTDIEDRQNRITHILHCQGLTPPSERLEQDATHHYSLMSAVTTQLKKRRQKLGCWTLDTIPVRCQAEMAENVNRAAEIFLVLGFLFSRRCD
jgi:hypothetical protein